MDDQTYTLTAEAGETERTVVLRIRGALDLSAREDLTAAITDIVGAGCDQLVIDLAGVTFIDSEALGGLLDGYATADQEGVKVTATGAQGIVRRVLQITGLLALFKHP